LLRAGRQDMPAVGTEEQARAVEPQLLAIDKNVIGGNAADEPGVTRAGRAESERSINGRGGRRQLAALHHHDALLVRIRDGLTVVGDPRAFLAEGHARRSGLKSVRLLAFDDDEVGIAAPGDINELRGIGREADAEQIATVLVPTNARILVLPAA